jgi:proteasome lid subunit RPN8/RPN11
MALELRRAEREEIERHGAQTYPNECLGMLLGRETDGRKVVMEVFPLQNAWENSAVNPHPATEGESSRNRCLVDPKDYLRADREARSKGMDIVGFYHSHPDHPARPSEFDRKNAWPWFSYVILAVEQGVPREMTGWLLAEDGSRFLPEELKFQI